MRVRMLRPWSKSCPILTQVKGLALDKNEALFVPCPLSAFWLRNSSGAVGAEKPYEATASLIAPGHEEPVRFGPISSQS